MSFQQTSDPATAAPTAGDGASSADSLSADLRTFLDALADALPNLLAIVVILGVFWAISWWWLRKRPAQGGDHLLARRLGQGLLALIAIVLVLFFLPRDAESRTQVLTFLGLGLSAIVGLAAPTFVANVMAGLMLRAVQSFRLGDFLRIEDEFGRVTERGLFHTEIQTERGNLTSLPNLLLIQKPVTVIRAPGTFVTAEVSLGYDIDRRRIETLLLQAAEQAGLEEAFVQVRGLGDFSVTYRISGLLREVRRLMTVRSRLHAAVLDSLHAGGVEIVSPSFMNQRQLDPARPVLPPSTPPRRAVADRSAADLVVFAKAEEAEQRRMLAEASDRLKERIKALEEERKEAPEREWATLDGEIDRLRRRRDSVGELLSSPADEDEPDA